MEDTKRCRDCVKIKPISEFSREKRNSDGLKSYCKICMNKRSSKYNMINKEARAAYQKDYSTKNREKILKGFRDNYQAKKESKQAYGRKYRKTYLVKAKDKVRALARNYSRRRRKEDPMFRLIMNLRRRLNHLLKGSKSKKTLELTGCDSDQLKKYLSNLFEPGMTWDNYGTEWHVDHIIALSKVDLFDEDKLSKVCHYSNLRPMWAEDNIRKSNK